MNMLGLGAPSQKVELSEAARRLSLGSWLRPARPIRANAASRRAADMTSTLNVELGGSGRLLELSELAAIPAIGVVDAGDWIRLQVYAPGATATNTEVRWDEAHQRLLVGVWCGAKPRPAGPKRFPPPDLVWFRSFDLPGCPGEHAKVRVTRGAVTIELPKSPELVSALWKPATAATRAVPTPMRRDGAYADCIPMGHDALGRHSQ
jgi:hypothetical protein